MEGWILQYSLIYLQINTAWKVVCELYIGELLMNITVLILYIFLFWALKSWYRFIILVLIWCTILSWHRFIILVGVDWHSG